MMRNYFDYLAEKTDRKSQLLYAWLIANWPLYAKEMKQDEKNPN